jgi:hypothetical protein
MQIPKICGFSINENAPKNLRNADRAGVSRMDCSKTADFRWRENVRARAKK